MIVRVATEGQYELSGEALAELDRLDDAVLAALHAGDAEGFRRAFDAVVAHVRGKGRRLGDAELRESHLVLPAPDTTFEEAEKLLSDYPDRLGEA